MPSIQEAPTTSSHTISGLFLEKKSFQEFAALETSDASTTAESREDKQLMETKMLDDEQYIHGFLCREHPLYHETSSVLKRVLQTVRIDENSIEFDITIKEEKEAYLAPNKGHIIISLGMLQFMGGSKDQISHDELASLFTHELIHAKYCRIYAESDSTAEHDDFDINVRKYIRDREEERRADIESTEFCNAAGYNPEAALGLHILFEDSDDPDHYMDFAMDGVAALTYDPHEFSKRRVAYLHTHLENHLYKNRGNPPKGMISIPSIDTIEEKTGLLHMLKQGNVSDAIENVQQPWQLTYVLSRLTELNILKIFAVQLDAKRDEILPDALPSLNQHERLFVWNLMTRKEDIRFIDSMTLHDETHVDIGRILPVLPDIFPEHSSLAALGCASTSLIEEETYISPLERVFPYLVFTTDGSNTETQQIVQSCMEAWQEKHPEWLKHMIDIAIRRMEHALDNKISETQYEELNGSIILFSNLVQALSETEERLPADIKQRIFAGISKKLARRLADLILISESAGSALITSFVQLCRKQLSRDSYQCTRSEYREAKFDFLNAIRDVIYELNYDYDYGSDPDCDIRTNYKLLNDPLLVASSGLSPQERAVAIGVFSIIESNTDKKMQIEVDRRESYTHLSSYYNTFTMEELSLPWIDYMEKKYNRKDDSGNVSEQGIVNDQLRRYLAQRNVDSMHDFESMSEFEYWSFFIYNTFVKDKFDISSKKGWKQLLALDVSPDILVKTLLGNKLILKEKPVNLCKLLEDIGTEKAIHVKGLLELYFSPFYFKKNIYDASGELIERQDYQVTGKNPSDIASEAAKLPDIPEKNFVLLMLIDKAELGDRAQIYQTLRSFFYTESEAEIKAGLTAGMERGTLYEDMTASLFEGGVSEVYRETTLGRANAIVDEAAEHAWVKVSCDKAFTSLGFKARIKFITDFFPEMSINRDKVLLTDTNAHLEEEWWILLQHVTFPAYRHNVGNALLTLIYKEDPAVPLQKKIGVICSAFPEMSPVRDERLHTAALHSTVGPEEIVALREVLFSEHTLTFDDDQAVYRLLFARVIPQTIYFANKSVKNKIFEQITSVDSDNLDILTYEERLAVCEALFSGYESIIGTPEFEASVERLFWERIFPPEVTETLWRMKQIELSHRRLDSEREQFLCEGEHLFQNVGIDNTDLLSKFSKSIDALTLDQIEELFYLEETVEISLDKLATLCETIGISDDLFTENDESFKIITQNTYRDKLAAKIADNGLYQNLPVIQSAFFEILNALGPDRIPETDTASYHAACKSADRNRTRVLSQFMASIFDGEERDLDDFTVMFLESIGPAWVKGGQVWASMGKLNEKLQKKLLRLTTSLKPVDILHVWHSLREEYGKDIAQFASVGPLIATASIRQAHKVMLASDEDRLMKLKLPHAIHRLEIDLQALARFAEGSRVNPAAIGGLTLPSDLVKTISADIYREGLSSDDIAVQNEFHKKYDGVMIGKGITLCIPVADKSLSTDMVTIETIAPGLPLSSQLDTLPAAIKEAALSFLTKLIFVHGKYHADPHPGNLLADSTHVSLVDFGMTSELNKQGRTLFMKILQPLTSRNIETVMKNVLTAHVVNEHSTEEVDVQRLHEELSQFFEKFNADEFQNEVLRFINILEACGVVLPDELKTLVKTVSQLGYLLSGQEEVLQRQFKREALKELLTKTPSKIKKAANVAGSAMKKLEETPDAVLRLRKGTPIQHHNRAGRIIGAYIIVEDSDLTSDSISSDPMDITKLAVIRSDNIAAIEDMRQGKEVRPDMHLGIIMPRAGEGNITFTSGGRTYNLQQEIRHLSENGATEE